MVGVLESLHRSDSLSEDSSAVEISFVHLSMVDRGNEFRVAERHKVRSGTNDWT